MVCATAQAIENTRKKAVKLSNTSLRPHISLIFADIIKKALYVNKKLTTSQPDCLNEWNSLDILNKAVVTMVVSMAEMKSASHSLWG